MHVDAVALTPDNLHLCVPLWGGAETYASSEMANVVAAAKLLLRQKRALGAVVLENGRTRAFGMTTFGDTALIDRYLQDPHPHIGKRLLLAAQEPRSRAVLDRDRIAECNAGRGLQLIVVNTGIDPAAHEPDHVLGRLISAFFDTHRGYRIARIVNEVFGEMAVSIVVKSGSYEIVRIFDLSTPGGTLRSLVGTLTREQAATSKNPLLVMFSYSPPRLRFTRAEQQLLSEALVGATDDTLSARLGIPLTAVKSRWARIQDRASAALPELFRHVPEAPHGGRGVQTRHLILQYVREHPSELTPYGRPRSRGHHHRVTQPTAQRLS